MRPSGLGRVLVSPVILLALLAVLFVLGDTNYLLFHAGAELFSVAVGVGIFVVFWNVRDFGRGGFPLLIGIAYLFVAFVDVLHVLAYPGMGVFDWGGTDAGARLWLVARALEAGSLLVAPLFIGRRIPAWPALLVVASATAALLVVFLSPGLLPACWDAETGTLTRFKIAAEFSLCIVLLAAALHLYSRRRDIEPLVTGLVLASIGVTVLSELAFTLYADPYGIMNRLGHVLKVVSFYLLYKGLIETGLRRPYSMLFRDLAEREDRIRLLNRELGSALVETRAELEATEEQRDRLVTVLQSSVDAIRIADPDLRVTWSNPAQEELTGWSAAEVRGRDLVFSWDPTRDESIRDRAREALATGRPFQVRIAARRRDGTRYVEEVRFVPITGDDGRATHLVTYGWDVTEELRMESIAESMTTMNNMGYVFAGVRHELGNPINSVRMTLEMLRSSVGKRDAGSVREYLGRALAEIDKVGYILGTLRTFNMYEKPSIEDLDTRRFFERLLGIVRDECRQRDIALDVEVPADVPPVRADARALQQVMTNVLANAMDALEQTDGPRIRIDVAHGKGSVTIRVSDNGRGMTPEELSGVFRPFYTTRPGGTGLGLVIAKKMVTAMNGTIGIDSESGEGSSVEIELEEGES